MKTKVPAILFCAILIGGCTSLRLTGTVVDANTGDVVGTCGITSGPKYAKVDSAGHFAVNVRKTWKTATLTCGGYETQEFPIENFQTRYPELTIRVTPRKLAKAGSAHMETASEERATSAEHAKSAGHAKPAEHAAAADDAASIVHPVADERTTAP
ncbi:MAG TPA: hypothetical protein VN634_18885 [Candidatus Limnocylindrales bacterium]|nr:hypothetical protein [Candidatus Limnocylindrales bacterium]